MSAEHKTGSLALRGAYCSSSQHRNSVARISTTNSADSLPLSKITRTQSPSELQWTGQSCRRDGHLSTYVVSASPRSSRSPFLCPSRYTQPRYTLRSHRPVDSTTQRLDDSTTRRPDDSSMGAGNFLLVALEAGLRRVLFLFLYFYFLFIVIILLIVIYLFIFILIIVCTHYYTFIC